MVPAEAAAREAEPEQAQPQPTTPSRALPMGQGTYRDMWVFCEQSDNRFLDVTLEMLGEARRLMDAYNEEYGEDEKVVACVLGHDIDALVDEAIARGADVVYACDHPDLANFRLEPYTRIVSDMALARDEFKDYDKPRYFLFPATNDGRDISATVLADLESGLASDCNKLYIEDVEIKHRYKTDGEPKVFERILHMKRPDFSGFEWSTILCLDNPGVEYSPQACSVIPGSFETLPADPSRQGRVVDFPFALDDKWLRIGMLDRRPLKEGIDLNQYDVVVALGRGIGDDPTRGFKLGLDLAKALGGELGLSRGVVTAKYSVDGTVEQYLSEERQIGETGQVVEPKLYIALGISGAIQHKVGMDQSETIVAVNTDETAPIRDFSDVFIHGDLFEVVPRLLEQLDKRADGGGGGASGAAQAAPTIDETDAGAADGPDADDDGGEA